MAIEGYKTGDIIAAEASPAGRGGLSVIRVSGPGAIELIGRLFNRDMPPEGGHRYGRLLREDDSGVIDDVVVASYRAPNSYTGEDAVEVSTHGSPVVVAEALDAMYSAGARPARPGEFTLRAYLNGRIDLTQAEAVADLIAAGSGRAADQARRQMQGGLTSAVDRISDRIVKLLSWCELELDFVEDDEPVRDLSEKLALIELSLADISRLLAGYRRSRGLREGIRVAIAGAPNVGKSSLFNALLGQCRAIVHTAPGTTRDVIQGNCVIEGISFEMFDTAGLRNPRDEVEIEGVRRSEKISESSNMRLLVESVDIPLEQEQPVDEATIRVMNKIDLGGSRIEDGTIAVSALTGEGMELLRLRLYSKVVSGDKGDGISISRERHYLAVCRAGDAMNRAGEGLRQGQSPELPAEELREALDALDEITGSRRLEGIIEDIFSRFCIGK